MSFEEEGGGSDTGSDDAEFMEKVNVYLNSRNSMNSSSTALEGILRRNSTFNSKVVKFEMDEEELEDAKLDADRSRQELLAKIARLTDLLKDAENQITMERDKRKKKEKNLMKLAKELKKRNQQKENDMDRLEEVRTCGCFWRLKSTNITDIASMIVGGEEEIFGTSLGSSTKRIGSRKSLS
jgi:hypothetical protein